jgi:hypothetical protein
MRAAPGRGCEAPRLIARLSRQIGIASLNIRRRWPPVLVPIVAEYGEFHVKFYVGPPVL